MHIFIAYTSIILIWSTTPLAVQWSVENDAFFGVAVRMIFGILGCWSLIFIQKVSMPFSWKMMPIYSVTGISLFLSMSSVYWSAQFIPSGWISVIYGLSPIITATFASIYLGERSFSIQRIIGMIMGFAGLWLIFSSSLELSNQAIWGIIACFFAVLITGISSVWIKHLNQTVKLSGLQTNVGGLTIALPLFIANWIIFSDVTFPDTSLRAAASMLYLRLIGTTLGFSLYYFLLKTLEATRVSLIALITPVTALLLGSWLNNEPIIAKVWLGTMLISGGLICFEFKARKSWVQLKKYRRNI